MKKLKDYCSLICYIILLVVSGIELSIAQELRKTPPQLFREFEFVLEQARQQRVPEFAPGVFKEAVSFYERAQQQWLKSRTRGKIDESIRLASESLQKASEVSLTLKPILSELVETQSQMNQNELVRNYSPELLNEAAFHYQKAIEFGESGDLQSARRHSQDALRLYRQATISYLKNGVINHLESELKNQEKIHPRKTFKKAMWELRELRETLDKAKTENIAIPDLNARTASVTSGVSQMISPDGMMTTEPEMGLQLHPETCSPKPPRYTAVVDRTSTSLTIRWRDIASTETQSRLSRRMEGSNQWEDIAFWGPLDGVTTTYIDSLLNPATRYYYRVSVRNSCSLGWATSSTDYWTSGYTMDGYEFPIWRAEIEIRTASTSGAETDDPVMVRLQTLASYPRGNFTKLDYGARMNTQYPFDCADDFQYGKTFTYDLHLNQIAELDDITSINIFKKGTDAWGLEGFTLILNNRIAYEKNFNTTVWVNGSSGDPSSSLKIPFPELRADPQWQAFAQTPPGLPVIAGSFGFLKSDVQSILEGLIGNALPAALQWGHYHPCCYCGDKWVEITRLDNDTYRVDLDLAIDDWLDPEVDIDFDLNFGFDCTGGITTLVISSSNFSANVDSDWFETLVLTPLDWLDFVDFCEEQIEEDIEEGWEPIAKAIQFQSTGQCPTVMIDEDFEDLYFLLPNN